MKKLGEIIEEIDSIIAGERRNLAEHGANNHMGSAAMAVVEAMVLLKDWILEL